MSCELSQSGRPTFKFRLINGTPTPYLFHELTCADFNLDLFSSSGTKAWRYHVGPKLKSNTAQNANYYLDLAQP